MGNLASATYNQTETIYKVPDAVGNLYRTPDRKGYTYSEGGRLLECPDWKYVYDLEGQLIEKISKKQQLKRFSLIVEEDEKPATLRWFYSWNANGSLKSVANNDRVHFAFEYDALGRRTAKINLSSKRIKRFLWDGNVPLHEWEYDLSERPNLSRDKDNLLVYDKEEPVTDNLITWVFDENSFVPAAKLVGDKSYSILTDHLGTPYEAYDENGEKVWARELDLYGNAIAGDSSFIPFLYQGQYYDEEIGLAYNRFRYYNPETGAYISQDPIGLAGGDPTLYGYVKDSNTWGDRFGLDIIVIGEGQKRVNNTARNLRKDGNTVRTITDDWPKELFFNPYDPSKHEQISLEYNREWIKERMNEGYDIYDIGEDGRKSPFYEVEQEEIKKNKYNKHYEYNTETKEKSKVCHS